MSLDIKVSVCVVTYNQEKYIAECLQSLVDQVTDFPFEIIVGEDCSTDRTREIVLDFQKRYPYIIKPLLHAKNVGPVQNIIETYKQAKGMYIAHMDGDDLALPRKLQGQADALDENSDCVICSHDMKLVTFDGRALDKTFKKHNKIKNTIFDLYETLPFFAHSSKMFVNDIDKKFWNELHPQALDIEVHVRQAKNGCIYHIDEALGVYRVNVGVSGSKNRVNPIVVEGANRVFAEAIADNQLNEQQIRIYHSRAILSYAYQSALYNDVAGYEKYVKQSIKIKVISVAQLAMYTLRFLPRLAFYIASARSKLNR